MAGLLSMSVRASVLQGSQLVDAAVWCRCRSLTVGLGCHSLVCCCSDVIAFKAVIGGINDAMASSARNQSAIDKTSNASTDGTNAASSGAKVKGASTASGAYTFWKDFADGIGADTRTVGPTTSLQACLAACDAEGDCAAAVMKGLTSPSSVPTSCVLVKGDVTPATFKRSMTKAVVSRLRLEDIFT